MPHSCLQSPSHQRCSGQSGRWQQRARARSRAIARAGACCTSRSRAQHRKSLMHSLQHSACGLGNGRREGFTRRCRVAAGAASATAAAMSVLTAFASMSQAAQPSLGAASPLATTWNTPALLTSLGIFLLCAAAAAFLICAIPTLWEMRRVARRTEAVLTQVERELPETAALLRLSGIEVTDCISELGALGGELTSGVRSTAKLATMAESSVRKGAALASQQLIPALAASEKQARSALEAGLKERASLKHTLPIIIQVASATRTTVARLRLGMVAANLAATAWRAGQAVRSRAVEVATAYSDDESEVSQQQLRLVQRWATAHSSRGSTGASGSSGSSVVGLSDPGARQVAQRVVHLAAAELNGAPGAGSAPH